MGETCETSANVRGKAPSAFRYVVGHGIDSFVGGEGHDEVIVSGRRGTPTEFLVEDAASYNTRTGSRIADRQVQISADGALIMSVARVDRIVVDAGDPADRLTVVGDLAGCEINAIGLEPPGTSARPDRSVPAPSGIDIATDGPADDDDDLLIFHTGGDEAGGPPHPESIWR